MKRMYKKYWKSNWKGDADWALDFSFIEWVNYWFKEYKKKASKMVDLTFHKFEYKGQTYTQIQLIDKIIELTDKIIEIDDFWDKGVVEMVDEVFELFHKIFLAMWW